MSRSISKRDRGSHGGLASAGRSSAKGNAAYEAEGVGGVVRTKDAARSGRFRYNALMLDELQNSSNIHNLPSILKLH